jgi:hypothetical protein
MAVTKADGIKIAKVVVNQSKMIMLVTFQGKRLCNPTSIRLIM